MAQRLEALEEAARRRDPGAGRDLFARVDELAAYYREHPEEIDPEYSELYERLAARFRDEGGDGDDEGAGPETG